MSSYESALLGRTEVAQGAMAFRFERPSDFMFKAGQYIDLTISDDQHPPSQRLTHTFSIASSPCEKDLVVTSTVSKIHKLEAPDENRVGPLDGGPAQRHGHLLCMVLGAVQIELDSKYPRSC
jgi:NAD(P)H-flavin reductase